MTSSKAISAVPISSVSFCATWHDDIVLVAAMKYADVDLPDGDAVWRFELVAPDRLVISRAALRVLSK